MRQFPASFPLEGKRVVIIGGGELARLKTRLLAASPAAIDVFAAAADTDFAPEFEDEFAARATFHAHKATPEDVRGATLAIVADEAPARAEAAAKVVRAAGVPLNVVDRPDLSDWHTPALVNRDEVVIAIATGGAAPVIARDLRARIEQIIPRGVGVLAATARALRDRVAETLPDAQARRAFWEHALRGPAAARADAGDAPGARAALIEALETHRAPRGVVHIVGAGPGDPELLTLKAARILQDADVIFHDALVTQDIVTLARRDAERVHVGKRRGVPSAKQDDIHTQLIAAARAGKRVVRLKGGDPFVFGRGGEELEALEAAGVEAHVVPGVTSALGCAAAIGVPLTHRDHAQAVTVVTGHAADGEPDLDWAALAKTNHTVVVYMGVATAQRIAEQLMAAGRAPETPVAVVENGTRADQKVARGRLEDLGLLVVAHEFTGPAVLIIGEVAARRDVAAVVEATAHATQPHATLQGDAS